MPEDDLGDCLRDAAPGGDAAQSLRGSAPGGDAAQSLRDSAPKGDWRALALADFRAWLTELDDEAATDVALGRDPGAGVAEAALTGVDLHAVYTELAALRQEIRLQTREQARALRQAEDEREARVGEVRRSARRECLAPMLEVRDALVRGREAAVRVAVARRWLRPAGLDEVAQGYEMALERLDRTLQAAGIRPVATVGQTFDARTMVAVTARVDGEVAAGTVLEELRAGFVAEDGVVLRAAEVVVSRTSGEAE